MYANNFFDDLSYSSIVVPSYRLIEITTREMIIINGASLSEV